jgi:hypothetical protein
LSFHDFSAVGLALANPDIQKNTMVTLILYDDTGLEIERSTRTLLGRSHEARFLAEIFDAHVSVGTVELESNVSIFASAFNLVEGEISVLEIRSSPVRYTLEVDDDMESDQAELVLWAEDVFVHGYLRFLMIDNEPIQDPQTYMVTGTLVDNTLRLTQMGLGGVNNDEIVSSLRLEGFSFDGSAWNGTYSRTSHGFPFDHLISGPFYMKREN